MLDLESYIRDVPDFPKPGILFKDITTLIQVPEAFAQSIDQLVERCQDRAITKIVGVESRGFIFGAPLALRLGVGFVPVRKPGKLPAETIREQYSLEYGTDALEIHKDALTGDDKVAIIDDLLATGGTMAATARLCQALGAEVVELLTIIELVGLDGREKIKDYPYHTLLSVEVDE